MSNIRVNVGISAKELVQSLADGLSRDAIYRLILDLDAQMADWDFTNRLHRYFAKQHELYLAEVAADAPENK